MTTAQGYDCDFEDEDDDEDKDENLQQKHTRQPAKQGLARSVPVGGTYVRAGGVCRRLGCTLPAAPHQVYCSREHSPYGMLPGDGPTGDGKQVYTKRPKRKKRAKP